MLRRAWFCLLWGVDSPPPPHTDSIVTLWVASPLSGLVISEGFTFLPCTCRLTPILQIKC